jgi:hypothetical protein
MTEVLTDTGAENVELPTFEVPVLPCAWWGMRMKPLILTCWPLQDFWQPDVADLAVFIYFRFAWGPLPSADELAAYFDPLPADDGPRFSHWSDFASHWNQSENRSYGNLALAEFCQLYETVELWFDTRPQNQLELIWLLDYFHSHPEAVPRLKLRLLNLDLIGLDRGVLGKWSPPLVDVTDKELGTASAVWQAYRAPTPEACFGQLSRDLSALPLLSPVLLELFNELPSGMTGLGATEMRMLELIGRGYSLANELLIIESVRQTRVFDQWQCGDLLDGLAFGPKPAISGLDDVLRTLSQEDSPDREKAYQRSRLSLTDFGRAVLARKEDFSRHNPIDRWWGGTHLTNDNLWRYDPVLIPPARQ